MNNQRTLLLIGLTAVIVAGIFILVNNPASDRESLVRPTTRSGLTEADREPVAAQRQLERSEDLPPFVAGEPTALQTEEPKRYGQMLGHVFNYDGTPASGTIGFYKGNYQMGARVYAYPVDKDGAYLTGHMPLHKPDLSAMASHENPLLIGKYIAAFKTGEQNVWQRLDNLYGDEDIDIEEQVLTQDFILREGFVVTGQIRTDFGLDPDEDSLARITLWVGPDRDELVSVVTTHTFGSGNVNRRIRGPRFQGDTRGAVGSGDFHFVNLPPGSYLLRYSAGERGDKPLYIARAFDVLDRNVFLTPEVVRIEAFDIKDPNPVPRAALDKSATTTPIRSVSAGG